MPAVVFDNLTADQVVELFVTINSKHTKLNPSHLISLAGRRLYRDDNLAAAHDVIRTLNEDEGSPLKGSIKVLGIGKGTVTQASLADELRDVFAAIDTAGGRVAREFRENSRRFFLNYFKAAARAFPTAFAGRKYSIKSSTSLRAFIRIVPVRHRHGPQARRGRLVRRASSTPRCGRGPSRSATAASRPRRSGRRSSRAAHGRASRSSPASCARA